MQMFNIIEKEDNRKKIITQHIFHMFPIQCLEIYNLIIFWLDSFINVRPRMQIVYCILLLRSLGSSWLKIIAQKFISSTNVYNHNISSLPHIQQQRKVIKSWIQSRADRKRRSFSLKIFFHKFIFITKCSEAVL